MEQKRAKTAPTDSHAPRARAFLHGPVPCRVKRFGRGDLEISINCQKRVSYGYICDWGRTLQISTSDQLFALHRGHTGHRIEPSVRSDCWNRQRQRGV